MSFVRGPTLPAFATNDEDWTHYSDSDESDDFSRTNFLGQFKAGDQMFLEMVVETWTHIGHVPTLKKKILVTYMSLTKRVMPCQPPESESDSSSTTTNRSFLGPPYPYKELI